jgi:hypothetical protein
VCVEVGISKLRLIGADMYDRLIAYAKDYGCGDTIKGLEYIGDNLEDFDEDVQFKYRSFMRLGAKMFAPVDD